MNGTRSQPPSWLELHVSSFTNGSDVFKYVPAPTRVRCAEAIAHWSLCKLAGQLQASGLLLLLVLLLV